MNRPFALRLATFVIVVLGLLVAAPAAVAHHGSGHHRSSIHPMIFVHGSTGSGAQFASQKMRFTENGYPDDYVRVFEYDSTFSVESQADVQARLDSFIAEVKRETGRKRVDLLGHSLGTFVSQTYLTSSPAHAANVAHYVNIDGAQAASPPGGVPTLAIWAGTGTPGRWKSEGRSTSPSPTRRTSSRRPRQSHSLRCSGSSPAIAPVPPTSCDSTAGSRSPDGRCCSRRTSASRQAPP